LQSFYDGSKKIVIGFGNIHKNEFLSNQILGLNVIGMPLHGMEYTISDKNKSCNNRKSSKRLNIIAAGLA
jgi:hypothetical protein